MLLFGLYLLNLRRGKIKLVDYLRTSRKKSIFRVVCRYYLLFFEKSNLIIFLLLVIFPERYKGNGFKPTYLTESIGNCYSGFNSLNDCKILFCDGFADSMIRRGHI